MPVLSAAYLERVCLEIARHFGAGEEEARIFARCFLLPDLRGHTTQGMAYLPTEVLPWLRDEITGFGRPFTVLNEGPAFAVVDGGHGLGQIVATRAMELAIRKARAAGVASVWVQNTTDFTMASNYTILALEQDCVGLVMSDGPRLVAPWGGRDPLFCTNPLSLAVPAGAEIPIVIDMATSAVSYGHVVRMARDGQRAQGPLLVDEAGQVTDDPAPLIVDPSKRESEIRGALLPLGPKGFGWLILVEVFAGLLSGAEASFNAVYPPTSQQPSTIGFYLMAIDVSRLMPVERFKAKVDAFIRAIKSSQPAEGFEQIVLPGERAAREEARRRREGVPMRDDEWAQLVAACNELGLDLEQLPAGP
jgi:LDH2 family malate/lactate/ureidoglycolate dehydrogenase